MPTPLKCTAFFGSDDGWGWSETHHKLADTIVGPLAPYLANFDGLMRDKRRPLLGRDRYIQGVRVSYRTATGAIASGSLRYTPLLYPGNQREGSAPHVAAKMRMGETTTTQYSDVYLRGFWDSIEEDEQLNFTSAAGQAWKALLDQYVTSLVGNNYGWLGTQESTTRRGRILSYGSTVEGMINFIVSIDSGPILPAPGTLLPFRAARLNNSESALNRTHVVEVVDNVTVRTVQKTAALPFLSQGTFVITSSAFLAYTGNAYTVLARRAAGKPFFHSPGRLKARARG